MAEEYNANSLNERSVEQIKGNYDNLKNLSKKYATKINKEMFQTGGGPSNFKTDVVFEKVLNIINKKTVYGEDNVDSDNITIGFHEIGGTEVEEPEIEKLEENVVENQPFVEVKFNFQLKLII